MYRVVERNGEFYIQKRVILFWVYIKQEEFDNMGLSYGYHKLKFGSMDEANVYINNYEK